jgi:hypothetical protein
VALARKTIPVPRRRPIKRENAPLARGVPTSLADLNCLALNLYFAGPIAQAQELPNLSAFVAVFLGFGRATIDLAEGMFGVDDCFLNQVQGLCHT